jgi:branched-chain amino acid transport system substrate-binding protein
MCNSLLQDGVPYGNGLAASFKTAAQRIGLNVVGVFEWRTPAGDYRDLSARARRAKADAVFIGGAAQENGPRLIADLRAALPHARLIGPDGMSQAAVLSEGAGSAAEGFLSTVAAVPPTRLPKAGRLFAERFRRLYGDYPAFYAVNSAQAAQMLLDAIAAAGPDRTRITAKLLGAHVSGGLIGDFDIDQFGDTSLTRMGLYRIELGRNKFVTSLWPPATLLDRK